VVTEVDPTGAGDVFAAAFFVRLLNTRDPWEAARFANRMAAISVTRPGVAGVPSMEEVQNCMVEILG
jgi:sugar/nucleoside kinase (ribokinase family)